MNARALSAFLKAQLSAALLRRPQVGRLILLGASALLTLAVLALFSAPLRIFEEQVGAVAWQLDPDTTPEERISIIAIDDKSLGQLGPWPWSRATLTQLSEALRSAGVQLQLYDIVFPEGKEGDAAFAAALLAGPAVLSQAPVLQSSQDVRAGELTHPLSGIQCSNASGLPGAQSYFGNAPVFNAVAKGHISLFVDADGGIRQQPAVICHEGQGYPALAISALLQATGTGSWSATLEPGSNLLAPAQQLSFSAYPGLGIPLDANGALRVSYARAPEAYRAFSAVDVINGDIDTADLANTWALVGFTAFGLMDIVPTPFGGAAPGVELHARILGSLLDSNIPYAPRAATAIQFALGVLFALVLAFIAARREKLAMSGLGLSIVLMPLAALLMHVQALAIASLWLGWLPAACFAVLASAVLVFHEYARVRLERTRIMSNFSSYLPPDLAQEIAYSLPSSSIDARRQNLTLLCADLRNFSAYSEARPPEESAALLHFFFMRATDIVERHQGQVREFKGDGLLAVWEGADTATARHALDAALEMQSGIQDLLPETMPQDLEPLALGIGIEQGPVLIGSIGAAQRRTYTMLGETVTIVLRIQDMTAELAQPILVGECAARQLPATGLVSQGSYLLNGLQTPHVLFAPAQALAREKHNTAGPQLRVLHGGRP